MHRESRWRKEGPIKKRNKGEVKRMRKDGKGRGWEEREGWKKRKKR